MARPSDIALGHLKRALARDPVLRDVLLSALPGLPKSGGFEPDADVHDTPEGHVVLLDVPGVPRAALRVAIDGAHLVVEGERVAPTLGDGPTPPPPSSGERAFGAFRREFLLPPDVDAERIAASLVDGVLRVEIPRRGGRSASRTVPIGG